MWSLWLSSHLGQYQQASGPHYTVFWRQSVSVRLITDALVAVRRVNLFKIIRQFVLSSLLAIAAWRVYIRKLMWNWILEDLEIPTSTWTPDKATANLRNHSTLEGLTKNLARRQAFRDMLGVAVERCHGSPAREEPSSFVPLRNYKKLLISIMLFEKSPTAEPQPERRIQPAMSSARAPIRSHECVWVQANVQVPL